ncbi:winged helix-turn-helix domain-containing protein [Streptomyces chryseus]
MTGRLGWSLQRPERRAVERDESQIARWIAHEVAGRGSKRVRELNRSGFGRDFRLWL